jgi:hypothetical protein
MTPDERDFISLTFGEIRVCFRKYVQWACNIQCLHTIENDNGDFHAVTLLKYETPFR